MSLKRQPHSVASPEFDAISVPKLMSLDAACLWRQQLAREGRRVVLTNGCFDLLHAGHIYFLEQARAQGDELFVAVNSDESVRILKGAARPVQKVKERAYALAALSCTSAVLIFPGPRLDAEIRALRPDIYVKAGDYSWDNLDMAERSALQETGTEIRFLPYLAGWSSTDLIYRIRSARDEPPVAS